MFVLSKIKILVGNPSKGKKTPSKGTHNTHYAGGEKPTFFVVKK